MNHHVILKYVKCLYAKLFILDTLKNKCNNEDVKKEEKENEHVIHL